MCLVSMRSITAMDMLTEDSFIYESIVPMGIALTIVALILMATVEISRAIRTVRMRMEIMEECQESKIFTIAEFLECHEILGRGFEAGFGFTGCFIFVNITKGNKSYVGQSKNVFRGVQRILNGAAIPELYSDIKAGNDFRIIMLNLSELHRCNDIFEMQKQLMGCYNALDPKGITGYNLRKPNHT